MDTEQPSSTSGYANPLDFNAMNVFSNHTEMASKGYCRLFKAQRYGRWYVLKGLQPQYTDNPQYAAMLEKEFQTAVNLKHPNIVNIYGIETDAVAGRCIVMEYVEGRTLAEFLKENPSTARRRKVAMQLLDAMQYYHALQIVHRDLKPSNILVTRNGDNVKLIDFGLADTDAYAILKGPAYTRGYAAPEQTVPDGVIDCRTDIYAFGLVLRLLFPRHYAGIVRHCTQNAPARRYPDALSVQKAIVRADRLRVILPVALGFAAIAVAAVLLLPKTTLNSTPATEAQTTDTLPQSATEPAAPTKTILPINTAKPDTQIIYISTKSIAEQSQNQPLSTDSALALAHHFFDSLLHGPITAAIKEVYTLNFEIYYYKTNLYILRNLLPLMNYAERRSALDTLLSASESDWKKINKNLPFYPTAEEHVQIYKKDWINPEWAEDIAESVKNSIKRKETELSQLKKEYKTELTAFKR